MLKLYLYNLCFVNNLLIAPINIDVFSKAKYRISTKMHKNSNIMKGMQQLLFVCNFVRPQQSEDNSFQMNKREV